MLLLLAAVSCRRSPDVSGVEDVRQELGSDHPQWSDALPTCGGERDTCARDVGLAIGTNFDEKNPDQISAAVVAVLVARDRHGSDVGSPDVWLASMRKAKGPGADALRLAVALEMSRRSRASMPMPSTRTTTPAHSSRTSPRRSPVRARRTRRSGRA